MIEVLLECVADDAEGRRAYHDLSSSREAETHQLTYQLQRKASLQVPIGIRIR